MTDDLEHPGPLDGLDNGSLGELREVCAEIHVDVRSPRPRNTSHHDIAVPERAYTLQAGLEDSFA